MSERWNLKLLKLERQVFINISLVGANHFEVQHKYSGIFADKLDFSKFKYDDDPPTVSSVMV